MLHFSCFITVVERERERERERDFGETAQFANG
jgi:hypothetical protein